MSSGKILYFVRPETKRPRVEADLRPVTDYLRTIADDARARKHFNELLKGIWPNSPRPSA